MGAREDGCIRARPGDLAWGWALRAHGPHLPASVPAARLAAASPRPHRPLRAHQSVWARGRGGRVAPPNAPRSHRGCSSSARTYRTRSAVTALPVCRRSTARNRSRMPPPSPPRPGHRPPAAADQARRRGRGRGPGGGGRAGAPGGERRRWVGPVRGSRGRARARLFRHRGSPRSVRGAGEGERDRSHGDQNPRVHRAISSRTAPTVPAPGVPRVPSHGNQKRSRVDSHGSRGDGGSTPMGTML